MESTGLFLKENQVHVGMTVALCLDGKDVPEKDEEGKELILKALKGGVPIRVKLYPFPDGVGRHDKGVILAQPMEGFKPNVRFMPLQIFSPDEAPVSTEFVVFVEGVRLKYEDRKEYYVYVWKSKEGRFYSSHPYYLWYREYTLPDGALLVPISVVGGIERLTGKRKHVWSA